jgi:hypothetical protein
MADVCFGSKADMCGAKGHVRFTPNSDIDCVFRRVTLGQKRTSRWLFDHLAGPERLAQHGTVAIESTKTANMAFLPLSHQDIYCHFTCDDEAGPLQWTCAQSPFSSLQA